MIGLRYLLDLQVEVRKTIKYSDLRFRREAQNGHLNL